MSEREGRTFVFADGKQVVPGDHPVAVSHRIEESIRGRDRIARFRANVRLVREFFAAVREANRNKKRVHYDG